MDPKYCLQSHTTSQVQIPTVSVKGKEKAVIPAPTPILISASPYIQPGTHNLNIQPSAGSSKTVSHQAASKAKQVRHCANCRDAKCPLPDMCKGRGNCALCTCVNHGQCKNPRAKTS